MHHESLCIDDTTPIGYLDSMCSKNFWYDDVQKEFFDYLRTKFTESQSSEWATLYKIYDDANKLFINKIKTNDSLDDEKINKRTPLEQDIIKKQLEKLHIFIDEYFKRNHITVCHECNGGFGDQINDPKMNGLVSALKTLLTHKEQRDVFSKRCNVCENLTSI